MVFARIDEQHMVSAQMPDPARTLKRARAVLNEAEDIVGMKMPGKGADEALEQIGLHPQFPVRD